MNAPGHESTPPPAFGVTPLPRVWRGRPVFFFYSGAVLLTGVVSVIFADLLWRTGWSMSCTLLLGLFAILFFLTAIGCMHGLVGFLARRFGDGRRVTQLADYRAQSIAGTSTAIVFPIYNEEVVRVYEGLRTTYQSLEQTGQLERFDFFILSDSTNPDKWIEEERRWSDLVRDLDALGRIYYRHRLDNEGKKSGNVRDFLNTWGRRYRYFIVFDADSVMRGETVVDLVKLMETHPEVGLIQTLPALANAESLFGRIQQFANRLYSPVFMSGLNFWAQNFGNYWGHNAIIRTEPFMHYCDLPQLPGYQPFGGQILSHDFVEAALLLRENWQIWFATDLAGSYEEAPQSLIESARRDRRWCQGNLQHGMVIFGLRGLSRMHLALGISGYLAGPLWLLFLLTFNWMLWFKEYTGLSDITVRAFTPFIRLTGTQHAFLIFVICMVVLLLPKVLALIDLALDPPRCRAFGGLQRATLGVMIETVFSTLHAPLQMLWHSHFVATILLGLGVNWGSQKRAADGVTWSAAFQQHWKHTLIGLVWGTVIWRLDHPTFAWFTPVLAGMMLSIPLSVLTSRRSSGRWFRRPGLLLTPEETSPPPELARLRSRLAALEAAGETAPCLPNTGIAEAILDPYVNASHVTLLREKQLNPHYAEALHKLRGGGTATRTLAEILLAQGPEALNAKQTLLILTDPDTMSWLHRQSWLRSGESLAPWWLVAIRRYAR
ncbi:MAG: glucans biosynthesis glucosyltransferase MdoH [Verrucomicrobia bacterium]|nr:glucans biosynthesis glucosyltransferase MdoH [Verrucomicrobiota bacterium]